ncbi:hypothetical protein [Methanoregula sp.]|uniref:hypothetical protein n=1 Tax=Methanoregula sp. TaxID=2052170 RepID=UPI0035667FAB
MTGRSCLLLGFFLLLLLAAAGCTTLSVGNVSYGAGNLTVTITNNGDPGDTGVQVRVYKLDEFTQHELLTTGTTVTLNGTENTIEIPLHLDTGRYKIYVYLTKNGQRETAVIRDITV